MKAWIAGALAVCLLAACEKTVEPKAFVVGSEIGSYEAFPIYTDTIPANYQIQIDLDGSGVQFHVYDKGCTLIEGDGKYAVEAQTAWHTYDTILISGYHARYRNACTQTMGEWKDAPNRKVVFQQFAFSTGHGTYDTVQSNFPFYPEYFSSYYATSYHFYRRLN